MRLSDPLKRCFDELARLCEDLQAENQHLKNELEGLKSKASEQMAAIPHEESQISRSLETAKELNSKKMTFRAHSAFISGENIRSAWGENIEGAGGMLGAARLGQLKKADPRSHPENAPLKNFREVMKWLGNLDWFHRGEDGWMATFCKSSSFKALCILMIVANAVYLGIAADLSVRYGYRSLMGEEVPAIDRSPEIAFTAWFMVELLVKLFGQGWDFWLGSSNIWNIMDLLLVLNSILELVLDSTLNLSFLRVFRVFRLVRVVRLVRTVQSLKSLRTMLFSIITSMAALFWAFAVLLLVGYMFSIVFSNGIAYHFELLDRNSAQQLSNAEAVYSSFGGVYETLVSLFAAISGGNDWMTYGQVLRDGPGEVYFLIFMFYIFFCLIGLLNVVTGIFVDSAVCTRTEDEVVESYTEEQGRLCKEMKRIFADADYDRNGFISFEEFCSHVEDPWVQAFLSGLDIDITDARIVFTLLDVDGNGGLTVEEFVDGALKLKGPAKGIDMLSMMFDLVRYNLRFSDFCSFLEEQTRQIKELVRGEVSVAPARYKTAEQELERMSHITNRRVQEMTMPSIDPQGFVLPNSSVQCVSE